MTFPSLEYQRGRETASEVERHWFVSRLRELSARLTEEAGRTRHQTDYQQGYDDAFLAVSASLDELIAERTR